MNVAIPSSINSDEIARLADLAFDRTVLEVGSWLGFSTVSMAKVARRVHAVDWHRGDPHAGEDETTEGFFRNLAAFGVRDRVVAHVGRSEDVLPILRPSAFSFAFHDAYHTTEAVTADLAMMAPLLVPGALLAVHDYGLFGVADAVDATGWQVVDRVDSLIVLRPDG